MKKLVKETLIEGVGDDYLKNKYNIPGEFDEFEKIFKLNQMKKDSNKDKNFIVYKKEDWAIIKNPSSIKNLGPSSRGVVLPDGNVYMESHSNKSIHNDILAILHDKNILPGEHRKNWGRKIPQDSGFLTVQRFKDTHFIAIGESNKSIYKETDWDDKVHLYDEFLEPARKKNPNLNFSNKLVGIKVFQRPGTKVTTDRNKLTEAWDKHLIKNNL